MKKAIKKLALHRETLHTLARVSGSAVVYTLGGYTCLLDCRQVPSVDGCGTNVLACASNAPPNGCNSGLCGTQVANGCTTEVGC